jgi:hypothetical protein
MKVIDKLTEELYGYLRSDCEENGACVNVCDDLKIDDEIDDERIAIIKVDEYYSTKNFAMPPKSVDCLFVIERNNNEISIFIVELKSVRRPKTINISSIVEKFNNTINNFMKADFGHIFHNEAINIKSAKLMLVVDTFSNKGITDEVFNERIKGCRLDQLNLIKPFKIGTRIATIETMQPNYVIC